MARDRFFHVQHVSPFCDNTTRNQGRSTDKLVPMRDVFASIINRFEMAYTQNEHINNDKELVAFRLMCPFCVFIKSKPGK